MIRAESIAGHSVEHPARHPSGTRSWRIRAVAAQVTPFGEAAIAIACAAAAVIVRFLLDPWLGSDHVYSIAIVATAAAALTAGWRAGLACALLAQVCSNFLFLEPRGTWTSLLMDPDGITFDLMTAILLFVTQLAVRAKRTLDVLVRRLHEADAAKSELLATIAHELRNPVSAMDLAVQCLEAAGTEPDRERIVGVICRQLRHISRLTDDLTDASRIHAGKAALRMAEHPVLELVSTARDLVEASVRERQQRINLDVPDGLMVRADGARIVQVLANLLHNASKYSPNGSSITVESRAENAHVCIKVADQGFGIPNEKLEWVFDTYAQLKPGGDGLGLGLSLVRKIVHLHGGTIKALSRGTGEGSTFEICLPQRPGIGPDSASTR